jgi:hypothetical protein
MWMLKTRAAAAVLVAVGGCTAPDQIVPVGPGATQEYPQTINEAPVMEVVERFRVGRDTDDAAVRFTDIRDIDTDTSGFIYVLDGVDGISVWTGSGELHVQFGSRGRAPSELWNARSMAVGGDTVFVLDETLKLFNRHGDYLGGVGPDVGNIVTSERVYYTLHGLAIQRLRIEPRRGSEVYVDTLQIGLMNVVSQSFRPSVFSTTLILFRRGRLPVYGPPVMGGWRRIAVSVDGRAIVTDADAFVIDVFSLDDGVHLERLVAHIPPVKTTGRDRDDFIGTMERAFATSQQDAQRIRREFRSGRRARSRPAVGDVLVSQRGSLLIERPDLTARPYVRYDSSMQRLWQVLDAERRIVGTLLLPSTFVPFVFHGCDITGAEEDALGVPMLVRFTMHIPQAPAPEQFSCDSI